MITICQELQRAHKIMKELKPESKIIYKKKEQVSDQEEEKKGSEKSAKDSPQRSTHEQTSQDSAKKEPMPERED